MHYDDSFDTEPAEPPKKVSRSIKSRKRNAGQKNVKRKTVKRKKMSWWEKLLIIFSVIAILYLIIVEGHKSNQYQTLLKAQKEMTRGIGSLNDYLITKTDKGKIEWDSQYLEKGMYMGILESGYTIKRVDTDEEYTFRYRCRRYIQVWTFFLEPNTSCVYILPSGNTFSKNTLVQTEANENIYESIVLRIISEEE